MLGPGDTSSSFWVCSLFFSGLVGSGYECFVLILGHLQYLWTYILTVVHTESCTHSYTHMHSCTHMHTQLHTHLPRFYLRVLDCWLWLPSTGLLYSLFLCPLKTHTHTEYIHTPIISVIVMRATIWIYQISLYRNMLYMCHFWNI